MRLLTGIRVPTWIFADGWPRRIYGEMICRPDHSDEVTNDFFRTDHGAGGEGAAGGSGIDAVGDEAEHGWRESRECAFPRLASCRVVSCVLVSVHQKRLELGGIVERGFEKDGLVFELLAEGGAVAGTFGHELAFHAFYAAESGVCAWRVPKAFQ